MLQRLGDWIESNQKKASKGDVFASVKVSAGLSLLCFGLLFAIALGFMVTGFLVISIANAFGVVGGILLGFPLIGTFLFFLVSLYTEVFS